MVRGGSHPERRRATSTWLRETASTWVHRWGDGQASSKKGELGKLPPHPVKANYNNHHLSLNRL